MKSDLLFDAIGELPDEYVEDARPATVVKRKVPWGVWAAAAACLVVAVLIAVPLLNGGMDAATSDAAFISEIVEEPESAIAAGGTMEPEASEEEGKNTEVSDFGDASNAYEAAPEGSESASTSNELPAGALTEAEFEEYNLAFYAGVFGGPYTYDAYLLDYANVTADPVFDALLNCDGTDRFFASSVSAYQQTQNATVYLDGILSGPMVQITHNSIHYEQDDEPFDNAGTYGIRSDYEIDGCEVQKYYERDMWIARGLDAPEAFLPNPDNDPEIAQTNFNERMQYTYWARIMIDGDWYMAYGYDEAAIDETMTALAAIANRL